MIVDRIRASVESCREQTLDLVRLLVEENSYSGNPEGLNRVGRMVLASLPEALEVRSEQGPDGVRHHIAAGPAHRGRKIILLGHLDTVFPPQDDRNPFRKDGKRIWGQGTADMKAGVVVMIQALRVLETLGFLEKIPLVCVFNGDEEVGSPFSEALVREVSRKAAWGLVFESGGPGGRIVTARRGVARFELAIEGRAGHAGRIGEPKSSALIALARQVLALEALNDPERGISLNVGTAAGGRATNIVPDRAVARFEYRFWNEADERAVSGEVDRIVSGCDTPGCTASLRRINRRPGLVPVTGSEELARLAIRCAAELGQDIGTEKRGGASDGNFLSDMGIPVIDGLGPVGDLDHSPGEFIEEESVHERIALAALLLIRLAGVEGGQALPVFEKGKGS